MIQNRILQYLDFKGFSKYKFYKITGLSNGFLDKKGAIGSDKCEIILSCFPDLSPEYLILGKGEMLRSFEQKQEENKPEEGLKDKIISLLEDENQRLKDELKDVKSHKNQPAKTN